jgi:hypothetical protein
LDGGRETLGGGGGVVKVMQARETPITAVVGAAVRRYGRRTGEGTAAATMAMRRCAVRGGGEARRGAVGDGGCREGCGFPVQIRE